MTPRPTKGPRIYTREQGGALDQGAPVSLLAVAREMGHGGDRLMRRIYGHMGEVRHRSEAVEYRVEQHAKKLGPRLRALRAG